MNTHAEDARAKHVREEALESVVAAVVLGLDSNRRFISNKILSRGCELKV